MDKANHGARDEAFFNADRTTPNAREHSRFGNDDNQFIASLPIRGEKDARSRRGV